MKKSLFYAMLLSMSLGMVACGSDDDELAPNSQDGQQQGTDSGKGKDNYKDLVVTGGIEKFTMDYEGNISYSINGYVNLTDSLKLLYGSLMEFGLELSPDPTFPTELIYGYGTPYSLTTKTAGQLMDNRRFMITFDGLYAETKYYYRSYIQTGNSLPIYGSTESFTTLSIEKYAEELNLKPGTPNVVPQNSQEALYLDYSNAPSCIGVFCSKDKSKLTSANIKNFINEHPALFGQPTYEDNPYGVSYPNYSTTYNIYIPDDKLRDFYYKDTLQAKNMDILVGRDNLPIETEHFYGLKLDETYYYCGFMAINKTPLLGEIKQLEAQSLAKSINVQVTADDVNKQWTVKMNTSRDSKLFITSYITTDDDRYWTRHSSNNFNEYILEGSGEKKIDYPRFNGLVYEGGEEWTGDFYNTMMEEQPGKNATTTEKLAFIAKYGDFIAHLKKSKCYYYLSVHATIGDQNVGEIKNDKRPLPLPDMTDMPAIEGDGSESNPYSVESAFLLAEANERIENVYVKGIVSLASLGLGEGSHFVNYSVATENGIYQAFFSIKDSSTSQQKINGNFYYLNGGYWNDNNRDIKIGDEVVVFCNHINVYNSYAFSEGHLYKFVDSGTR